MEAELSLELWASESSSFLADSNLGYLVPLLRDGHLEHLDVEVQDVFRELVQVLGQVVSWAEAIKAFETDIDAVLSFLSREVGTGESKHLEH